jgi:hypothetical protein
MSDRGIDWLRPETNWTRSCPSGDVIREGMWLESCPDGYESSPASMVRSDDLSKYNDALERKYLDLDRISDNDARERLQREIERLEAKAASIIKARTDATLHGVAQAIALAREQARTLLRK